MHPSNNFDREYIVQTDKPISHESMRALLKGVPINDGQIGQFNHISEKELKCIALSYQQVKTEKYEIPRTS